MSWRRAAAALVRLAPAAVEAVPASQGLPALAAALRHHAMLPTLPSAEPQRSFASSALQQQAEAAVAEDSSSTDLPPQYSVVGRIASQYTVAPKRVFAVVEVGGCQFKVTPDDVIVTEKLRGVDVNDTLQLPRVLLLGSEEQTVIGRPFVPEAYVTAAVEEQFLDGKVYIFHKRRRKNSRRLKGHRQPLTTLRILDVHGIEEAPAAAGAS